jgi:hypothetical protein
MLLETCAVLHSQIDGSVYSVRRFIELHFRFEHKLLGLCVAVLLAYCIFFRLAAAFALKKVGLPSSDSAMSVAADLTLTFALRIDVESRKRKPCTFWQWCSLGTVSASGM